MTYCVERVNLLRKAGRTLAEELLPEPFRLWHSDHDTGAQMTIVAPVAGQTEPVWKGSIWHSSIYEFNDQGAVAGLQPAFEFAREAIEKYFAAVQQEVDRRSAKRAAEDAARAEKFAAERRVAMDALRKQVSP